MEKLRRSLVLLASPFLFLLLLFLLYAGQFGSRVVPFNQWKKQIADLGRSGIDDGIDDHENLHFLLRRLVKGNNETQLEATGFACHSDLHTDVCVSNRPVRIDTLTMKVYAPFSEAMPQANKRILPFPKKEHDWITRLVSPVQILQGNFSPSPPCRYTHTVPAIVFSSGLFTGNAFHDFNEIIIPLFLTSRLFQSRVRIIVTDFKLNLFGKYKKFLSHLSNYEILNPAANVSVHCFPGLVVGLHYHEALALNTTELPGGYSMLDFKQFLRESYNLKVQDLSQMEKPKLILISRQHSRMFLNEEEMVTMMKALGFIVVVAKPEMMANLDKVAQEMNSCSVLVGAHGAGLTNALFLPQGAVMVEVVGLGLDSISEFHFGKPSKEWPLHYIAYKVEPEESSLFSLYGKDHPIIADPESIISKGYETVRDVYIRPQNFNIDVARFRKTLVEILGLLGRPAPLG